MQFQILEELPYGAFYIEEEFDPFKGRLENFLVDAQALVSAQLLEICLLQCECAIDAQAVTTVAGLLSPTALPNEIVIDAQAVTDVVGMLSPVLILPMSIDAQAVTDGVGMLSPVLIPTLSIDAKAQTYSRLVMVQFFKLQPMSAQAVTSADLVEVSVLQETCNIDAQGITTTGTPVEVVQLPDMWVSASGSIVLNPATGAPIYLADGKPWQMAEPGAVMLRVEIFPTMLTDASAVSDMTAIEGTV